MLAATWWRPALTNLGRRKPRGSGTSLWGKCADGRGFGCNWRPAGRVAGTEFNRGDAHEPWIYRRSRWLRPYLAADHGARHTVSRPELQGYPGCHQCGERAFRHAACSRGGARDRGCCPRRKISMMRMGPPQQGQGSRRVSGMILALVASFDPGTSAPSKARILQHLPFGSRWPAGRNAGCGGTHLAERGSGSGG